MLIMESNGRENMIKIEIEIDADKARRECKYTPESIMNCLDATFAKGNFPILEADEFRRVYRDSGNVKKDYGIMGTLILKFAETDWFAACVKKIIWYNNGSAENWLESMRRDNYGCIKGN